MPRLIRSFACAALGTFTLASGATAATPVPAAAGEIGLTPEALIIADLGAFAETALQRTLAESDLRDELEVLPQTIAEQHQIIAQTLLALQDDPGNSELISTYQQAQTALDAALYDLDQARSELFNEVTDGLSGTSLTRLQIWRDGARRRVDPAMRASSRTDEQWKAIEIALRAERRATRIGEELDDDHAALLTAVRAEPAVAAATLRMQTQLASVTAQFQTYAQYD